MKPKYKVIVYRSGIPEETPFRTMLGAFLGYAYLHWKNRHYRQYGVVKRMVLRNTVYDTV